MLANRMMMGAAGAEFDTKLLLHMDGADSAQVFTDSSYYGHTVSAVNEVHTDTTTKVFGTASAEFDGVNDRIEVPSSPAFGFGTGDFCIDFIISH